VRRVDLDSFLHYQFRHRTGGFELEDCIDLVAYGDQCPAMGEEPSPGNVIATFHQGDEVEFVFSTIRAKIGDKLVTTKIICGGDFARLLDNKD